MTEPQFDADAFRALLTAHIEQSLAPEAARIVRELSAARAEALKAYEDWHERQAAAYERRAREYAGAFEAVLWVAAEMEKT